jgi:hypothetical protein
MSLQIPFWTHENQIEAPMQAASTLHQREKENNTKDIASSEKDH